MKNSDAISFDNPAKAFAALQNGLSRALKISKFELEIRVAKDNADRDADRIQRGYPKRGPKPKKG